MKDVVFFGLVGLVSGIITNFFIGESFVAGTSPGWIFGMAIALGLFLSLNLPIQKNWRLVLWVVFSTSSYLLAVLATIISEGSLPASYRGPLSFFIGGSVGALVLFIGLRLLYHPQLTRGHIIASRLY